MTRRGASVSPFYERRLDPAEVAAWLAKPISGEEITNVVATVQWFTRRYPTARDRLAYARRAYARWVRHVP